MSEESMALDPYEIVLADLRAKKAQIEQAISAIENIRGTPQQGGAIAGVQPPNSGQNADVDSPGAFLGMSIVDAAKKLLAAKRQPLRNPDIAAAFKRGGLAMNSKDAVNTIGSVLTRRANEVGDLVKVDRGTWGLKEWYPNRSFKKEPKEPTAKANEVAERKIAGIEAFNAPAPLVITQDMRDKLREHGASEEDIREMTLGEAQSYLEMLGL